MRLDFRSPNRRTSGKQTVAPTEGSWQPLGMSPHAILVQPQGRLSIGVAAAFLLSACSHSTFNDSAFSPNTGVLARAPHTAGLCLALGPWASPLDTDA